MKRLLFVFVILQTCGFALLAQNSPPPPPPLIYKTPEKTEIKEFTAEDKSFQAAFPGVPKLTKQNSDNGSFSNFRVYRAGSNSVINITEFAFDVENNREKIYELVRDNFLKTPKSKIEIEKDISVNGKPAKEFEVLRDFHYQKTRIVVVENRVYEITSDVTNWHIIGEKTKKEFFDETERFFNSFKIKNVSQTALIEAPADFLGVVEKNIYKNTFFDISLNFPADWDRLEDAEIQAGKIQGLELLKSDKERLNKAFEQSTKNEVVIFAVSQRNPGNETGTNLIIGILKQPNSQVTAELVAAASKNLFVSNPKIKVLEEISNIDLNGTKFSTFLLETTANDRTIKQKVFITMRKGYSVSITMSYYNEEGLKSLEGIIKSLNFKGK